MTLLTWITKIDSTRRHDGKPQSQGTGRCTQMSIGFDRCAVRARGCVVGIGRNPFWRADEKGVMRDRGDFGPGSHVDINPLSATVKHSLSPVPLATLSSCSHRTNPHNGRPLYFRGEFTIRT
jgi:hypothetical protein